MLSHKMQQALNDQINAELHSAYIYLSMAAYFEGHNLAGMAAWMGIQVKEEMGHAMRFFEYINDRRGQVLLKSIEGPATEWSSPLAAFENAFKHEQYITDRINKLAEMSIAENDHATSSLLTWFVDEQVEEEASVDKIVQALKQIGDSGSGIYMLDHQLGKRGSSSES